jgi:hypothetical protein
VSSTSCVKRSAAAALLAAAGACASVVLTPATAHADPRATGSFNWCPGQYQSFVPSGPDRPNWDWNVCHTYWTVWDVPGNVATYTSEGGLPPAAVPLENLTRPVNCGLFFCQDPGGRYTVDPRLPAP